MLSFSIYIYKMKIFLYKWINAFFGELHPLFFFVLLYACSVLLLLPFSFNFVRANLRIFLLHHYNLFRYAFSSYSLFFVFFSFLILLTIFFCSSYSSPSSRNCSKFDEPFSSKWTYKLNILYFNCGSVAACAACVQMNVFCSNECQALDELKLNVHWCHIWQIKIFFCYYGK